MSLLLTPPPRSGPVELSHRKSISSLPKRVDTNDVQVGYPQKRSRSTVFPGRKDAERMKQDRAAL